MINPDKAHACGVVIVARATENGYRLIQFMSAERERLEETLDLLNLTEFKYYIGQTKNGGYDVKITVTLSPGTRFYSRWLPEVTGKLMPLRHLKKKISTQALSSIYFAFELNNNV